MLNSYSYIIVGAGLSGASAVEGIRERDSHGSILFLGAEKDLPYDRPPLSKQLWTGGKTVAEIVLHDNAFYKNNGVDLRLGTRVIQALEHSGRRSWGISYYRTLPDYRQLRRDAVEGKSALVIGGGFVGSELAASLCATNLAVTMIFPSAWLVSRVFPESLGRYLTEQYRAKGVDTIELERVLMNEGTSEVR